MKNKQIEKFLKENWFKVAIIVVLLFAAYSLYNIAVIQPKIEREITAEKETQERLQERVKEIDDKLKEHNRILQEEEDAYWKNLEETVISSRSAASGIRTQAQAQVSLQQNWLNQTYQQTSNQYYYTLVPLISAAEGYIKVLESLIQSITNLNSVRYDMLQAIKQRDSEGLDALDQKETDAINNFNYWMDLEQKTAKEVNATKTSVLKTPF